MKHKIYFFESNIPMDKTVYLPLVSGILQSYAQTFPALNENYEFMPFIFMRDTPENMIKDVKDPFLMAFSVCIWNHQLSLAVAKLVKQRYPDVIIVFGGPQITEADKPYCDYIIQEEGEKKFVSLLAELAGKTIDVKEQNLNDYPSPYTKGLYAGILKDNPSITFQAIIETNRGCPFTCSFCYWGQGFEEKKVRHHSLEYVKEEAEWIGRNRIKYIFMADANFGMYERDYEVAKIYCETKEKYGYPEKVRVCYGKNKEENVFKTAKLLHEAGLAKAITLAKQSNDMGVLTNIRRNNIKLSVYNNLQERYQKEGIATYVELILGLPGETKASFIKGVEEIVDSPTQLFIYHCSILENTEMSNPLYLEKHGIQTVRVPLTEIHCEVRKPEYVTEYEDVIIETNAMTKEEWIECAVYAWVAQLKNSFDTEVTPVELSRFQQIAENITNRYSRGQVDRRFGNVVFEPEEMAFLRISLERGDVQGDMVEWAKQNVIWGRKSRVHQPTMGV